MPTVSTTVLMASDAQTETPIAKVRPILKWAGGKRQLLPTLRRYYPATFSRYVEPFLGSGAVFLDCHNQGLLDGRQVQLSDINADVIGCYRMVRDDVESVIEALSALEAGHRQDGTRHFYAVRDESVQRAAPRRPCLGRTGEGVYAGARGDADLPQSHRLQRALPPEFERRIQRAGRALSQGHDLRCHQPQTSLRGVAASGSDGRGQRVRGRAWRRARGRLRLSRSSLRARQSNGAFHLVHSGKVRPRRTGPAAAGRRRGWPGSGRQCCSAIPWRRTSAGCMRRTSRRGRWDSERSRSRRDGPSTRERPGAAPCASTSSRTSCKLRRLYGGSNDEGTHLLDARRVRAGPDGGVDDRLRADRANQGQGRRRPEQAGRRRDDSDGKQGDEPQAHHQDRQAW